MQYWDISGQFYNWGTIFCDLFWKGVNGWSIFVGLFATLTTYHYKYQNWSINKQENHYGCPRYATRMCMTVNYQLQKHDKSEGKYVSHFISPKEYRKNTISTILIHMKLTNFSNNKPTPTKTIGKMIHGPVPHPIHFSRKYIIKVTTQMPKEKISHMEIEISLLLTSDILYLKTKIDL